MSELLNSIHNGEVVALKEIPRLEPGPFRQRVIADIHAGGRLAAFFALPSKHDAVDLFAVLAFDSAGILEILCTAVKDSYLSLTPDCPEAHWFEREIAETWGIRPEEHPWLKPIRFHPSYRPTHDAWHRAKSERPGIGETDFFKVDGEEVHEVAVGPVHAGIIEPGHFRFQCHGEKVLHLEISLGYQHRGVEKALAGGPNPRTLHYMETLAGDTTIGHTLAYCQMIEALSECEVPARAQVLRAVALELERLANHTGDLGALANDVGYLPTASYSGRIRGDFLNLTAVLCGNRFGRGLLKPGGVNFGFETDRVLNFLARLDCAVKDAAGAVRLLWETPSVLGRFEDTGLVSPKDCAALGLVGPPARACGLERDVRFDFPSGIFRFSQVPVSTWPTGDVFARAYVRWLEIERSTEFIRKEMENIPEGAIEAPLSSLKPNSLAVSLTEGWRGEICHVAVTDDKGRLRHYKIVDPSFHNWFGLALAMRGGAISDFPLCNKSFNLSYCGHDL